MTLNDAYSLLAHCCAAMPARYPKPRLVIHESAEALVAFLGDTRHEFQVANGYHPSRVMAIADPERNAIHATYATINDESLESLLDTWLHEIGHLYEAQKYGAASEQALSEPRANAFARRWMKRARIAPVRS